VVRITVHADDGHYATEEEIANVDERFEQLLQIVAREAPMKLEQQIYEKITFVLCPQCRNRLLLRAQSAESQPRRAVADEAEY